MSETKKTDPAKDPNRITLKNVRLCFPILFKPEAFGKKREGDKKFSLTSWLHKKEHAELIKSVQERINELVKTELKIPKLPAKNSCLRDGEDMEGKDGFGPHMMYLTSSSAENRPPQVVDRQLKPMSASDPRIHAGCRANVVVRLWVQDNDYGKKINAGLEIVQWVAEDEAFGTSAPAAGSLLDELPEDDESKVDI